MKKYLSLIALVFVSVMLFTGCGQTDEDIANTAILIGHWRPVDSNGNLVEDVPVYYFAEDNQGNSSLYNTTDTMQWELKRNQLKIYYEQSPGYYIGYDKYNSRSLARLREISANSFTVTQLYSDGFQREISFQRYDPEE